MASGGDRDRPAPERHVRYRWAAEVIAGGGVLDAGCGGGWGTAVLAERAREAVGIDLSPTAVLDAESAYGESVQFLLGDLRDLPLADGEFGHVVCFEALAHVAEPERVLDELCRVLRPGGTLLVSVPNPATYPAGNPLHLSETTPDELERLLRARFANVAVHRQQTYFASLLGDAELLAREDPAAEIEVGVAKLRGEPPGSELHAVAAASDGELPPAPTRLALGEDAAYEERQRPLEQWRRRAVEAEAEVCALQRKLREQRTGGR
jgi:SAM-dependent methyltransferase